MKTEFSKQNDENELHIWAKIFLLFFFKVKMQIVFCEISEYIEFCVPVVSF